MTPLLQWRAVVSMSPAESSGGIIDDASQSAVYRRVVTYFQNGFDKAAAMNRE